MIAGAVIGAIGGLIGLILGTLRVPALIRWVGEEPARAVGTNLVIGIAVGAAGLLGHLPNGVDWTLLAIGGGTSVPGALAGSRYTGRLSTATLLRAIGVILLISGVYYSVDILPAWMQVASRLSPATYVLDAVRRGVIDGDRACSRLDPPG